MNVRNVERKRFANVGRTSNSTRMERNVHLCTFAIKNTKRDVVKFVSRMVRKVDAVARKDSSYYQIRSLVKRVSLILPRIIFPFFKEFRHVFFINFHSSSSLRQERQRWLFSQVPEERRGGRGRWRRVHLRMSTWLRIGRGWQNL